MAPNVGEVLSLGDHLHTQLCNSQSNPLTPSPARASGWLLCSLLASPPIKLGWEVVRELLLTILLPAVAEYAQSRQHTAHSTHALPAHAQCRQDTLKVTGRGLARPGLVQQLPVPVRDQGNNIFIALKFFGQSDVSIRYTHKHIERQTMAVGPMTSPVQPLPSPPTVEYTHPSWPAASPAEAVVAVPFGSPPFAVALAAPSPSITLSFLSLEAHKPIFNVFFLCLFFSNRV